MLYEGFRSGFDNAFHINYEHHINFGTHIHRSYEMIVMLDGELFITVNETEHHITRGDALIVFPHQRHSYRCTGEHRTLVFIFSPGRVPYFHRQVEHFYPISPVFSVQESCVMSLLGSLHKDDFASFQKEAYDPMMSKGILYMLASCFMRQCQLVRKSTLQEETLLERILLLVDATPINQLSLQAIADRLEYDYAYLSKYFKQLMNMTFTTYVNQYRIHTACQILRSEKCKIIDVALRVGYNNLRSFNGNFKKITGLTPLRYIAGEEPLWQDMANTSPAE